MTRPTMRISLTIHSRSPKQIKRWTKGAMRVTTFIYNSLLLTRVND